MARQKATDTGADVTAEAKQEAALDTQIRTMIVDMAKGVSIDLNKHQIQASILTRLEKWANKKINSDGGVMCPDWDSRLPKYVQLITQVSNERSAKVAAWQATKGKDKRKEFEERVESLGA
jgi:hypothetical protein